MIFGLILNVGGIAAALTTPLDVAKTRIMLASAHSVESKGKISTVLKLVYKEKGFSGYWKYFVVIIFRELCGNIFNNVVDVIYLKVICWSNSEDPLDINWGLNFLWNI